MNVTFYKSTVAVVYATFLSFWIFCVYKSCGEQLFSLPRMTMISGTLKNLNKVGIPTNRSSTLYEIEYKFIWNGIIIEGNNVAMCTGNKISASAIYSYAGEYFLLYEKVNKPITIWIDPEFPNVNYIFKTLPNWWLPLYGIFLLLGLASCFSISKWMKRYFFES